MQTQPGRTKEEFRAEVLPTLEDGQSRGITFYMLFAPVGDVEKAVGIVSAMPLNGQYDKMEPHVTWFPWASARNKIEAATVFFDGLRQMWDLFLVVEKETEPFFSRLVSYNVLRRVGTWERYVGNADACLFQTRRF